MEQVTALENYTDLEKGAYLGAIASMATADREAGEAEMAYLDALSASAGLSEEQAAMIRRAATELTGEELNKCLDVLKNSDLRFSLITDLIAFAEADQHYSEEEKQSVAKIADYLGVNKEQFSLLDRFAKTAKEEGVPPEEAAKPDFLESHGLKDKMEGAGINTGGFLRGLLGVMGPIALAGMLSGGRRGGMMGGGLLGGGMMGGGLLGLGSLIGMIGGGRFSGRRNRSGGGFFGF